MTELLPENNFFCLALTVAAFCVGSACQKKWKLPVLNPILMGAALVMLALWALDYPVEQYRQSCQPLTFLTTPATICLAIAFYEQLGHLKRHLPAIAIGVTGGSLVGFLSVLGLCKLFGFNDVLTATLLPKSITSAIGAVLSEQAGGIAAVATAVIIITGIFGNMVGPTLAKLLRLEDPIAQGVSFGTASHVVGTSRAMELSELAGAVSSLSLVLAGMLTVIYMSFLSF